MNYSVAIALLAFVGQCTVCLAQGTARCPVVRLQNGRVRGRSRARIIKFSCYDGFTLVGNKYSTCLRGQWDTPAPVCVNAECPTPPTPEHALMAPKHNGAVLIYFCEPGYALIGPSEIYCDGRQWNGTAPHCRDTTAAAPTRCDFEQPDICWWEQDPQHDFDWRRHNFETPSSHIGTGPSYDHTRGPGNDGYYLYVEASGRLVNDTARIMSPLYSASLTQSGCFSFWYHMYGATMGGLRVYFKEEKNSTARLMFKKDGNQGNQWLHGIFPLPRSNQSFQIIMEGVRGLSYVSDIAVDDVAILQGDECNGTKTEPAIATTNDDDQIEMVNSLQTCRGRCSNGTAESYTTIIPSTSPDACHCTVDCAEQSICCPDFAEYCVLGFSDDKFVTEDTATRMLTTTTLAGPIRTTARITTSPPTKRTTTTTTASSTAGPPTTRRPIPVTIRTTYTSTTPSATISGRIINPKDDIASNSFPVVNATTSVSARQTVVARDRTTRRTTIETNPPSKETPFVRTTETTRREEAHEHIDDHSRIMVDKIQHIGGKIGIGMGGIIAVVIGILIGVAVTMSAAFLIVRRRKTYKKGSGRSALSDDSDVRFLTSDEILDFNLARPNDNDEL